MSYRAQASPVFAWWIRFPWPWCLSSLYQHYLQFATVYIREYNKTLNRNNISSCFLFYAWVFKFFNWRRKVICVGMSDKVSSVDVNFIYFIERLNFCKTCEYQDHVHVKITFPYWKGPSWWHSWLVMLERVLYWGCDNISSDVKRPAHILIVCSKSCAFALSTSPSSCHVNNHIPHCNKTKRGFYLMPMIRIHR